MRLKIRRNRREAAAEEAFDHFIEGDRDAMAGEDLGEAGAAQDLAVDEDTIAIEDDQTEIAHGGVRPQSVTTNMRA